jgi:hypothetical protein
MLQFLIKVLFCLRYITYSKEDEAIRCIQNVHGFVLEGRPLRYRYMLLLTHLLMFLVLLIGVLMFLVCTFQGLFWNHKILSCMAPKFGMKIRSLKIFEMCLYYAFN